MAAAEAGRRRAGRRLPAGPRRRWCIGFLDGPHARRRPTSPTPACSPRAADAVRRLHDGPRFVNDFDMFAPAARGTCAIVREHGFPLPDGYDDHADRLRAAYDARSPSRAGATVPCNNDLLAGNFIDDGEQVWLIDYEYSGNNDACFELGNTATECDLDRRPDLERWSRRTTAAPTRADARPGAAAGAVSASTAGRCGAASRPASSPIDFDFWAWAMERFEKARPAGSPPPASTDLLDEAAERRLSVARRRSRPGPGRRHRRRRDRHQRRLPPDPAGLDRRAAARAGPRCPCGTTWHAAGLVGQLRASESGTRLVQYSAELYAAARGRDRAGAPATSAAAGVTVARTQDRMTQLRRTAATADAYGLECELLTPDAGAASAAR